MHQGMRYLVQEYISEANKMHRKWVIGLGAFEEWKTRRKIIQGKLWWVEFHEIIIKMKSRLNLNKLSCSQSESGVPSGQNMVPSNWNFWSTKNHVRLIGTHKLLLSIWTNYSRRLGDWKRCVVDWKAMWDMIQLGIQFDQGLGD